MIDENVPLFYAEIASVCARYGVSCLVGNWISDDESDLYGMIKGSEIGNSVKYQVAELLGNRLAAWDKEINKDGAFTGHIETIGIKLTKK